MAWAQVSHVGEAVEAARRAVAQGADMIDIGGQSTRPNAPRLDAATECSRIIPAIRQPPVPVVPLSGLLLAKLQHLAPA